MRRYWLILTAFLSVGVLAACNLPTPTPTWGPNTLRNGAGQPIDPVYGTPIPGYPLYNF